MSDTTEVSEILGTFDEFIAKVMVQSATCMRQEREIVNLSDEIKRLHSQMDEIAESIRNNSVFYNDTLANIRDNSKQTSKDLKVIVNNCEAEARLINLSKEVLSFKYDYTYIRLFPVYINR